MKKKILLYILIPLFIIVIAIFNLNSNKSDAIKFKEEYEKYNNKYYRLNISDANPIKYSNYDEVFNIIESGTGIIFIGYPKCNKCRKVVSNLIDISIENEISKIYYLNIKNDMDYYEVNNKKLVYKVDSSGNELKGSKNYFKLLKKLDKYLDKYIIIDNEKEYDTSEKRIKNPTIIFVRDGEIIDVMNTFDSNYKVYIEDYIMDMTSETCSTNGNSGC